MTLDRWNRRQRYGHPERWSENRMGNTISGCGLSPPSISKPGQPVAIHRPPPPYSNSNPIGIKAIFSLGKENWSVETVNALLCPISEVTAVLGYRNDVRYSEKRNFTHICYGVDPIVLPGPEPHTICPGFLDFLLSHPS